MQAERRAGFEAVGSLQWLRHTFCSRLARQGAPTAAIQALARHSSYSTTARYVHLFEGAKESAIRLLDNTPFGTMSEQVVPEGATGAQKRKSPVSPKTYEAHSLRGVGDLNP
jgi:hypothetical protein